MSVKISLILFKEGELSYNLEEDVQNQNFSVSRSYNEKNDLVYILYRDLTEEHLRECAEKSNLEARMMFGSPFMGSVVCNLVDSIVGIYCIQPQSSKNPKQSIMHMLSERLKEEFSDHIQVHELGEISKVEVKETEMKQYWCVYDNVKNCYLFETMHHVKDSVKLHIYSNRWDEKRFLIKEMIVGDITTDGH